MARTNVPQEDFIRACMEEDSISAVALRLGIDKKAAYSRYRNYRLKKIRIKDLSGGRGPRRLDVDKLNTLIETEYPGQSVPEANGAAPAPRKRSRKKS